MKPSEGLLLYSPLSAAERDAMANAAAAAKVSVDAMANAVATAANLMDPGSSQMQQQRFSICAVMGF